MKTITETVDDVVRKTDELIAIVAAMMALIDSVVEVSR